MSDGFWTAYEAAAATGGALCARGGDPNRWEAEEWAARGVSIDSRTLKPGQMFVALQDARDGHDFIANAFDRGASAALVARAPADAPEGKPLLVVRDTLEGLRDLARAARLRNFGKRVAVTGSVGKTSVKEMLRVALAPSGVVHAADKSFNNHWGVPLTLASMPMRTDFGVFEIGMNHAGEITPLTGLVEPHVAIVTTVAAAHLEFFDSIEGIAEAKAEIFTGLTKDGVAVLPADNDYFDLLSRRADEAGAGSRVTFGASRGADFRLIDCAPDKAGGSSVTAEIRGDAQSFRLGAPGRHQAVNALATLAAAEAVGADLDAAVNALAGFGAGAGRGAMQLIEIAGARITLIDESYNANPASMASSIALLGAQAPAAGGRRIAVLGDMLELGPASAALHRDIAQPLIEAQVDCLYAAGEAMAHLWDAVPDGMKAEHSRDADALAQALIGDLRDGDIVMVKGSNASGLGAVVAQLRAAGLDVKQQTG